MTVNAFARLGPASLLALAAIALAPPALAFRTAADLPEFSGAGRVRWPNATIAYVRSTATPGKFTNADMQLTLSRAFRTWSRSSCGGVLFDDRGTSAAPAAPGDGINTIQWVSSGWESLGAPADAPGLTDTQYVHASGEWLIAEADLYLNAEHHAWSLSGGSGEARDLASVVTHEAGHMLGLLHPCEFGAADGAPDCADVPGTMSATMYPAYDDGSAALSADDEVGLCFLYPRTASDESSSSSSDETALLGDPCVQPWGCSQGSCSSDGYCRPECTSDADCASGGQCDRASIPATCLDIRAPLGTTCAESGDCLGSQCLADVVGEPLCTRLCASDTPCPPGWDCVTVGDRDVCAARPELAPTGGCHAGRAKRPNSSLLGLFGALTFTALRRVQRGSLFVRGSARWPRRGRFQTEDRGVI